MDSTGVLRTEVHGTSRSCIVVRFLTGYRDRSSTEPLLTGNLLYMNKSPFCPHVEWCSRSSRLYGMFRKSRPNMKRTLELGGLRCSPGAAQFTQLKYPTAQPWRRRYFRATRRYLSLFTSEIGLNKISRLCQNRIRARSASPFQVTQID